MQNDGSQSYSLHYFQYSKDKEGSQVLSLVCRQKTIVYPNKEASQLQTRCYLYTVLHAA